MTLTIPENMRAYLNLVLESISESIAPTEAMFRQAEQQYDAITKALNNNTVIAAFNPKLRPQGSMRLGTVTRSHKNDGNFDVDVIVELRNIPSTWTQKMVKEAVLNALLNDPIYGKMLKDKNGGRRCVTIVYANGSHVDVLPCAISADYIRSIQMKSVNPNDYILAITDKKHRGYSWDTHRPNWPQSNPIGYADWFLMIALKNEIKHKGASALLLRAEVETFPKYQSPKSKTILQKIVMLLKRHRDMMFDGHEDMPVSILLTTLAAKAYDNAPDGNLLDTLVYVVNHMTRYITYDGSKYYVFNPVNDKENFADKWEEKSQKKDFFYRWIEALKADIQALVNLSGEAYKRKLKEMFGETATVNARAIEGDKIHQAVKSGLVGISSTTGTLTRAANRIASPPHTNLAGKKPSFPTKICAIPIQTQLRKLVEDYPKSKGTLVKGKGLWYFTIKPTPKSEEYKLRISFTHGVYPVIEVVKPNNLVREMKDADFNHIYRDSKHGKQMLCLYAEGEWTPQKFISRTIVPWAAEWCYFYEVWLDTGKWLGGGYHKGVYQP